MNARKIYSLMLLLVILLSITPLGMIPIASTSSSSAILQLPRATLVKLWTITHGAYMAKFYGEKYIVVFTLHGDVSLDGKYISSWKTAYVYKADTGELLGTLTPDTDDNYGDTWEVLSWEPFQAQKIWDRMGFFSADSKRMIENIRALGTNARVVDTTSWITIPIDWGFTDTSGGNFYATQLDYAGSTLFVGHISDGTIYVYKYDVTQGKYVLAFSHQESGNYGRRAHITLDGKYIVVGGIDYPYMDIWEWDEDANTYTRVVHYQLPDSGGLGGLGISDPYEVGYVIGGTKNGWVIIAYFDVSTKEFNVIYQKKEAPDDSWIYNPFYERWIPKVTEVFALCSHRDSSRPGYGIVYDVLTNQTIVIHFANAGTPQWSAAAVSPEAGYVFIGNSLYMVVKRDVQSAHPRVRFWGTMEFHRDYQSLGDPLVLSAPERDWHMYFFSGKMTISRLYIEPITVDLVEDEDILYGRLTNMHERGLTSATVLYTDNAEVPELEIIPGTEVADILAEEGIENPEHYLVAASLIHFVPPPYFWEGQAWYGSVIHIPLDKKINVYDDMVMQMSANVHTSTLLYDVNKRALGVLGIPVEIGGGVGMGAIAYSKLASKILVWYASRHAVSAAAAAGVATSQTVAKAAGIVGIVIAVWGGVDAALVEWGGFGHINIQNWIVIAPEVKDALGNKYTAVELVLPLEEADNVEMYYNILSNYFTNLGYVDVGFRVTYPCSTWDEYKALLAAGYAPQVELDDLIEETVAAEYGLDMDELRIEGVDVMILTTAKARETFWEWLFGVGGVDADTVTVMGAATITVKGRLRAGTITSPSDIADLLKTVNINGIDYQLTPGSEGAYTEFAFTLGTDAIVFDFGDRDGYYADMEIDLDVMVKKEFQPLENFGYTVTLHYDWADTMVRLWKIEFSDMPYPMLKAERIFVYQYGNFTDDITDAFELVNKTFSDQSPTGVFYHYATTENTLIIDPANGGIMQYCKTYIFNYFYRQPPDVGIKVFLNGTSITSTLASHATVVINNTMVEQSIAYTMTVNVKYYEGMEEVTLISVGTGASITVPANETIYIVYDISQYVDMAIEFMLSQGKTAFVEVIGRIVRAEYNYYKDNDEYIVVYYPSPQLPPPLPPGAYNVTVRVYEYVIENYTWIPSANATVEVYYGRTTETMLRLSGVTDENGTVRFTLAAGTWTFKATKEGFEEAMKTVPIYNDTTIQLYLAPVPTPPPENRTPVYENVSITFNVYDATNATPIQGANITVTLVEPENSTYYNMSFTATTGSDGKAVLELPIGMYNITVNATGYRLFNAVLLFDRNMIVNIPLVPEGINITEYAKLEVRVRYSDGKPYQGAHVEIRNATDNTLIAALATNGFGNATVLLKKNYDYNVSVSVEEPLYSRSYYDEKIVTLLQDTIVTFTVPWTSPQPPTYINETPYYYLTVQVMWANGLPFHGALVKVYNYTTGALIDTMETNGTGTVNFLLPAFQMYTVFVNATNPYNTSQIYINTVVINLTDNRWIIFEVPWMPEEPELSQNYRVLVYAYNVTDGVGVPDVTVILKKGDLSWVGETNSTGYVEFWIPFLGLYNVTGVHPDYAVIWRSVHIYENNTLINLPLTPVIVPPELNPPLNGTYPPIYINMTPYYWLSVQVVYQDGYPFHGANVTVYDLDTNETIATGLTNGTGFVHFLIPGNKTIKYTVDAFNPELNESYHAERTVNMTQHYFFVHVVPWISEYYAPEVWLKDLEFIIHRGQGYFYGNVSHLVLLTIWTNKPQTVTVEIALYNVTGGTWVQNKTTTLTLDEGVNTFYEWVNVNASAGGYFKVFANITSWESDTNITNNWRWSNTVFLKPQVDIQVFVLWRPVEQKQTWSLLPEDIIEIDIGIKLPINTSNIPARLEWKIEKYDLMNMVFDIERGATEDIRTTSPGTVWRNITVAIPWTSRIVVTANVTHVWEDLGYNNYVNITIEIDPDVKLNITEKPTIVMEGATFTVVVNITSNVEPGKGIGWVSLVDNTTNTLLKRVEIELAPQKTVEVEARAPENPAVFWIFRTPTTAHHITAQFVGYDLYLGNNREEFTLTVMSYQWLTVIAIIVVIIAVIAAFRALTHTIHDIRQRSRKFVKKKTSFLTESIQELKECFKFVKKKKHD